MAAAFIGNGGGEYGVRGYVTAYGAGKPARTDWRFCTVAEVKDPTQPFEHPDCKKAAKTWKGGAVVENRRRRHGLFEFHRL